MFLASDKPSPLGTGALLVTREVLGLPFSAALGGNCFSHLGLLGKEQGKRANLNPEDFMEEVPFASESAVFHPPLNHCCLLRPHLLLLHPLHTPSLINSNLQK